MLSFQSCLKMFNMLSVLMFLLCCYYSHVHSDDTTNAALSVVADNENDDDGVDVFVESAEQEISHDPLDVFYPTKEWNTVKPGQAIPRGLHVRLNLQTGEREAKLLETDESSKKEEIKYWNDGQRQGMMNTKDRRFNRDELKQALKNFKTEQFKETDTDDSSKQFRSYSDLKEDFKKMNLNVKTDMEVISDLVKQFNSSGVPEEKISILTELEYHLHQIDNDKIFCDMGGMPLLASSLNDTDPDIRLQTAFVLGSALQSNPKVQISAIENGITQQLIRMLSLEKSDSLRKKIIYALSSLIRHFPYAQKKFIELGGLTAFGNLLSEPGLENLKVKIVTLVQDLVLEKETALKYSNLNDSMEKEKLKQYNDISFKKHLLDLGWCEKIPILLEAEDHDIQEKVLAAMDALMDTCQQSFKTSYTILKKLKHNYESQYTGTEEDDYLISLTNLVSSVIDKIQFPFREEL